MRQFNKLVDAISYYKLCPICDSDLSINDKNLLYEYNIKDLSKRLAFELSSHSDDILFVNPITEEVELVVGTRSPTIIRGKQIFVKSTPNYYVYSGVFANALTIECSFCCKFSYVLQVWVDLTENKISGIYLNSENILYEDKNNIVHEIKISFATKKLRYSCFDVDGSEKHAELPIIPVNINNLEDAVARIKRLLIFS
ncbi:hypothetical protein UFOVP1290_109 [uncultured Caudovirales phage]|uniref:Uncharacterized protein n=1 Tax=uncultured Caudovirales phage TaxID=2100421 RepID=A0A6J5RHW0_9CAUD|nr:hypothetical protein UFOVP1290_109 [uncultured Caudovirales phage]